jgi:hypothetical protein
MQSYLHPSNKCLPSQRFLTLRHLVLRKRLSIAKQFMLQQVETTPIIYSYLPRTSASTVRPVSTVSNLDPQKRHHMRSFHHGYSVPQRLATLVSDSTSERNNAIFLPRAVLHRLGLHRNPTGLLEADSDLCTIHKVLHLSEGRG